MENKHREWNRNHNVKNNIKLKKTIFWGERSYEHDKREEMNESKRKTGLKFIHKTKQQRHQLKRMDFVIRRMHAGNCVLKL